MEATEKSTESLSALGFSSDTKTDAAGTSLQTVDVTAWSAAFEQYQ